MATDEAADTIIYGTPDLSTLEQEWDVPFMNNPSFRINAAVAETSSLKKLAAKLRVRFLCACALDVKTTPPSLSFDLCALTYTAAGWSPTFAYTHHIPKVGF